MLRIDRIAVVVLAGWITMWGQAPEARPSDPAIAALAARLEAAGTGEERAALLDADAHLATPELVRACLDRGQKYASEYHHEEALHSYQAALAVAVKLGDAKAIAGAWQRIGMTRSAQGNPTEGLVAYRSALESARSAADERLVAETFRLMGVAHRALGNFQEALQADGQSLEIQRRLGDPLGELRVLNGMGASYARMGDLRKAAELFERCAQLGREAKNSRAIYTSTEALGNVYIMQGDSALALRYLEQALALRKESGTSKTDLANNYINLIVGYRANGRDNDALDAAGHALALAHEAADEPSAAYALLNRAAVYRDMRRFGDALDDLRASLAIYEKENSQLEIAGALSAMAQVELDLNHDGAALETGRRAAEFARHIPAPDILWAALESEGTAQQRLKQPERAREAYEQGVDTVEEMRKQLAGGEQEGLNFLRDKMNLFHGLMALDVEGGQTAEALRIAERAKAGLILDVLRAGHAGITKAMTAGEKQREQQLSARLAVLRPRASTDAAALAKAEGEWRSFRAELYAAHPELKVHRGESEPLSPADAAKLLPGPESVLLEFAVAPQATYLFAISLARTGAAELHVYKLPWTQEGLAREVDAFRRQLAERSLSYRTAASSLYRRLLGPAAEVLRRKTLLVIVPDGPLWSLPFQALVVPGGRHLIEDAAVFYAPSLTALLEITRLNRTRTPREGTLLAMGDPAPGAPYASLGRLPNAAREVAALGELYGKGSVTLIGAAASEAQWKALAPGAGVIHLATHGNLNTSNPLYSYVLLSAGKGEDGLLEAREILDMNLSAGLVVLSACETGRGGFHYGEGLVGLSWALMVAGSPASVVSQWKVDSASTTEFMMKFHAELRSRRPGTGTGKKAAAFRSAALGLLKDAQFRHPYYWAGFVLVGDGY